MTGVEIPHRELNKRTSNVILYSSAERYRKGRTLNLTTSSGNLRENAAACLLFRWNIWYSTFGDNVEH